MGAQDWSINNSFKVNYAINSPCENKDKPVDNSNIWGQALYFLNLQKKNSHITEFWANLIYFWRHDQNKVLEPLSKDDVWRLLS